ncbi:MAG: hypothetical protein KF773_03700 [Deltaproteobacteria bacterium]|nr:hypothetical protein [Deltaproteobacteria bacterium]
MSGAAHADVVIASKVEKGVAIHRLSSGLGASGAKVERVWEETGKGAYAYAWGDARTLWVLRKVGDAYSIGKVVDGKAQPAVELKDLVRATPGKEIPSGYELDPELAATADGKVFVTTCLGIADAPAGDFLMHCEIGYRRVDDGSHRFTKWKPANLRDTTPPVLPEVKAPAGYAVTFEDVKGARGKVRGFVCKGPGGATLASPQPADLGGDAALFTPHAKSAAWVRTSPPIVRIELRGTSPVREKLDATVYVDGCTKFVDPPLPLRDGLWIHDGSVRRADGTVIGATPGWNVLVAP